jgi:4-hydroxy-tetrahydrodipicolinate synthase
MTLEEDIVSSSSTGFSTRPRVGAMCVTPFDEAGALDEAALTQLVDYIAAAGVSVYLGSYGSGEGHLLRPEEIIRIYQVGVKAAAGRVPVYAAALGFTDTARVIEDAFAAVAAGVDAVQIHPPRPGPVALRPRPAELEQYYRDVLDAVSTPVLITTQYVMVGYQVPLELVGHLVDRYDQVIGVNCSDPDTRYLGTLIARCPERVPVYTGMFAQLPLLLTLGGAGMLCFEADIAPRLCLGITDAAGAGDWSQFQEQFGRGWRLNEVLSRYQNPRSVKAALRGLGLPAGNLRRPYLALEEAEAADINSVLADLGIAATEGLAR